MPDQQPLMLDEEGKPLPRNACGHFTVHDPDGHELFFNTHPHEREPFEAALAGGVVQRGRGDGSLGHLAYCLDVTALNASLRFYESLGLRVLLRDGDSAWITPPAKHEAIDFVLQLCECEKAGSRLRFYGGGGNVEVLRSLGFAPDTHGWAGTDPDHRRLEFLPASMLPRR